MEKTKININVEEFTKLYLKNKEDIDSTIATLNAFTECSDHDVDINQEDDYKYIRNGLMAVVRLMTQEIEEKKIMLPNTKEALKKQQQAQEKAEPARVEKTGTSKDEKPEEKKEGTSPKEGEKSSTVKNEEKKDDANQDASTTQENTASEKPVEQENSDTQENVGEVLISYEDLKPTIQKCYEEEGQKKGIPATAMGFEGTIATEVKKLLNAKGITEKHSLLDDATAMAMFCKTKADQFIAEYKEEKVPVSSTEDVKTGSKSSEEKANDVIAKMEEVKAKQEEKKETSSPEVGPKEPENNQNKEDIVAAAEEAAAKENETSSEKKEESESNNDLIPNTTLVKQDVLAIRFGASETPLKDMKDNMETEFKSFFNGKAKKFVHQQPKGVQYKLVARTNEIAGILLDGCPLFKQQMMEELSIKEDKDLTKSQINKLFGKHLEHLQKMKKAS